MLQYVEIVPAGAADSEHFSVTMVRDLVRGWDLHKKDHC